MRSAYLVLLILLALVGTAMAAPARPEMRSIRAKASAAVTAPEARRLVVAPRSPIEPRRVTNPGQQRPGPCNSILCSNYIVVGF